jgi:hypothetical protein
VPATRTASTSNYVGRVWYLGLHADQTLDRLFRGQLLATQQHLPLEQGPVEGARREHERIGHRYQSSLENLSTPPTSGLGTCTGDTRVSVALPISSTASIR